MEELCLLRYVFILNGYPVKLVKRNIGEIMGGGNFESGVGGAGATCRTSE